jgi:hypothetical protein
MSSRTVQVATINALIRCAVEFGRKSNSDHQTIVLRFEPDIRVDREFGRLTWSAPEADSLRLTLYSISAEQFAAAVRRRHPAVAAWATTERVSRAGAFGYSEDIRLRLAAMPMGQQLGAALRATKHVRSWAVGIS